MELADSDEEELLLEEEVPDSLLLSEEDAVPDSLVLVLSTGMVTVAAELFPQMN